jgi:outer membrane protein assembly factor BamB
MNERDVEPESVEVEREYGGFPDATHVHGVTFDGRQVWFAAGDKLQRFDPKSGKPTGSLATPAHAGTAYDGAHIYQIAEKRILKIDPETGEVVHSFPAPGDGMDSGLTWAEGLLWVGQYRERKIHCVDPKSGQVLRTITSNRFVTGVTWAQGELWHGTGENEQSELRQVDAKTGRVLRRLVLPAGVMVSGLESDGVERLFCGGGSSGTVRVVKRRG